MTSGDLALEGGFSKKEPSGYLRLKGDMEGSLSSNLMNSFVKNIMVS